MEVEELLKLARKVIENSYSPYSNFRVSAVLIGSKGVYKGVNVENVSYGLTICAERVAIFKAISEGERNFSEIFIYSPDGMPYPCGACRQVMREFCSDDFRVMVSNGSDVKEFTLKELLPFSFKL
ncbi:MAG: cytidine deaminase [Desulfurobacteriaceae bacterium]